MLLGKGECFIAILTISLLFHRLPILAGAGPISMIDLIVILGVLYLVWSIFKGDKLFLPKELVIPPLLLFIISTLALITGFISDYKIATIIFSISMLLKMSLILLMFYFCITKNVNISIIDSILKAYVLIVFFCVVIQYLGFPLFGYSEGSPAAFYNGRNEMIMAFLPISLYVSFKDRPKLFFIIICFLVLLLSRGRTGMLIFVVMSILMVLINKNKFRVLFGLLFASAIGLYFLPSNFLEEYYYRFFFSAFAEYDDSRGSIGIRLVLYDNIFNVIKEDYTIVDYLLGHGESGFRNLSKSFYGMRELGYVELQPHNTFLGQFVNFGILSLCVFLLFISYSMFYLYKQRDLCLLIALLSAILNLIVFDYISGYIVYFLISLFLIQSYQASIGNYEN